jgi:hypothetical protein
MSQYDPLYEYLTNMTASRAEITLRFADVEQILGMALPDGAYTRRPWWGNEPGTSDQAQARAWVAAGWRVDSVDLGAERVHFRRV